VTYAGAIRLLGSLPGRARDAWRRVRSWRRIRFTSGGLVFTFGLGAIAGPLITGWAMQGFGPFAFWLVLGATFSAIALYALYRMTQRATVHRDETESYLGVLPTASTITVEAAGAWAADHAQAERKADAQS